MSLYLDPLCITLPARLDDCEIPYAKVREIQYVDLFPNWDDGFKKILQAIEINVTKDLQEHTIETSPVQDDKYSNAISISISVIIIQRKYTINYIHRNE